MKTLTTILFLVSAHLSFSQTIYKYKHTDSAVMILPGDRPCDTFFCLKTTNFPSKNPLDEYQIFKNNNLHCKIYHNKDTLNYTFYFSSGTIRRIQKFLESDDLLYIWDEQWYENKQLKFRYNPNCTTPMHLKVYYPDGKLEREAMYAYAMYYEFHKEFNVNGTLAYEAKLTPFVKVRINSQKISEKEYDMTGIPIREIKFENNKAIDTTNLSPQKADKATLKIIKNVVFVDNPGSTEITYTKEKIKLKYTDQCGKYSSTYNYGTKKEYTIMFDGSKKR